MLSLAFYPAFAGTILSIAGLGYLAYSEHSPLEPKTLSELGAGVRLTYFRAVLWTSVTLLALTMYFFVGPRIGHEPLVLTTWSVEALCEVLLGVYPARGKTKHLHAAFAYAMAVAMMVLVTAFAWALSGTFATAEIALAVIMAITAILTFTDKKNFLFYELPFVFLSHISIVVAALALR